MPPLEERKKQPAFPKLALNMYFFNFPFSQEERDLAIIMKTLHCVQRCCLLAVQDIYPSCQLSRKVFTDGVLWNYAVSLTNGGSSTDLPVASSQGSPCGSWIPSLVQFSMCLAFKLLAIN